VKLLRPSRLITRRTTLENAQEAYAALENGKEIAVAFEYR
jgi:threonine dehydrogenase-like Zn-dependent dehydrogenase